MNTSAWRWFPHWLIASMALVFVVNGYMVYDAYTTFPGVAGQDGFDLSNEYKRVLDAARQQAALGWKVEAAVGPGQAAMLHMTAKDGSPLTPTAILAHAERPLGPPNTTVLKFRPAAGGGFIADPPLAPGQWDILLRLDANGHTFNATRRVIVK